ncbi:hypothetical protein MKW94_008002, partial [Papaver nudicaule]|nr:hypothetical protein [Papaver nudicaule]
MKRIQWLKIVVLLWLITVTGARVKHTELLNMQSYHDLVYNHTLTKISVEYAFVVSFVLELIVDVQHSSYYNHMQAFFGVAKDLNAVVIAFRGTREHMNCFNWVGDLFWKQIDLNYLGMTDAILLFLKYFQVHQGFYSAYHNTTIRPCILNIVRRAKKLYEDIPIMVTGHSMAGDVAYFCALDLSLFNLSCRFIDPHIANSVFASYFSKHVPNTIRVTQAHDMVPHLPLYYTYFPQKTYHHFPRAVWIYNVSLESLKELNTNDILALIYTSIFGSAISYG